MSRFKSLTDRFCIRIGRCSIQHFFRVLLVVLPPRTPVASTEERMRFRRAFGHRYESFPTRSTFACTPFNSRILRILSYVLLCKHKESKSVLYLRRLLLAYNLRIIHVWSWAFDRSSNEIWKNSNHVMQSFKFYQGVGDVYRWSESQGRHRELMSLCIRMMPWQGSASRGENREMWKRVHLSSYAYYLSYSAPMINVSRYVFRS